MTQAARAAEQAARASYGRLLAALTARSWDISQAEDALSDAFAKALTLWPASGIPDNPDAWLMRVARNRMIDMQRRDARLEPHGDDLEAVEPDAEKLDDRRLQLMFVCAHPAIDPKMHTPLMLQCVMGLDAEAIGRAFVVPKATMAQRLVRAKAKIKANAVPFDLPKPDGIGPRLQAVLEAIYGGYSADWLESGDDLGMEALFLADVLCQQVPDHAEAWGLAALLGFSAARRDARVKAGVFIPLDCQDPRDWDHALTRGAAAMLRRASALGQMGRFQLEAAIQSVHARRLDGHPVDWRAVAQLYAGLCQITPTLGAQIGYAAALAEVDGPQTALGLLNRLETRRVAGIQSYHATRAHLLMQSGQPTLAVDAYDRALSLTPQAPLRAYLSQRRAAALDETR